MKPAPAGFAAAVRAPARSVATRVRLWPNGPGGDPVDISDLVESVNASRELSGQLPDDVRLVEGAGTAKLELGLAGIPPSSTAATWARGSASGPLGDAERLAVPITVDIGISAVPGSGWCRVFTGQTRAVSVDGQTSASLTALDARDTARAPLTFPPVADAYAGLRLSWCAAYAAHRAGFYALPSPAQRHGTDTGRGWWPLAYWPMAGGHAPFIAGPNTHAATLATRQEPGAEASPEVGGFTAVPGPSGQAAAEANYYGRRRWRRIQGRLATHRPDTVTTAPPITNLRIETSVRADTATMGRSPSVPLRLGLDNGPALVLTSRGGLILELPRRGTRRGRVLRLAAPLPALDWRDEAWNHVGVHITVDAAGHPEVTWRVNGDQTRRAYRFAVRLGHGTTAHLDSWLPVSNIAISRAAPHAGWLNATGWARTALITHADSPLLWPGKFGQQTVWEHLSAMANATGAATYFDTSGRLNFHGPPEAAAPAVAEVTTRHAITELSVEDSLDRVRNHVTVPEQHGTVKQSQPDEPLWSHDGPRKIQPGQMLELDVEFSQPCLSTSTAVPVTATPGRGENWIYADYSRQPQASGRPVPAHLVHAELSHVTGNRARLVVRNEASKSIWITKPPDDGASASANAAAAGIHGHYAKPSTTTHTEQDRDSIARYGAYPFEDGEAAWRQSGGAERARRFITDLADPHTAITGLSIVGDPRLSIGDVVTIRDPDGTRLDGDWAVTGITDDHTPSGGYTQTLSVHPAPQPLPEKE